MWLSRGCRRVPNSRTFVRKFTSEKAKISLEAVSRDQGKSHRPEVSLLSCLFLDYLIALLLTTHDLSHTNQIPVK
jgi:hypothetical protein